MKTFEPGLLRVACADPDLLLERLQISDIQFIGDDSGYVPNAITYTDPRQLTPAEKEAVVGQLIATPDTPASATLELVRMPPQTGYPNAKHAKQAETLERLLAGRGTDAEAAAENYMRGTYFMSVVATAADARHTGRVEKSARNFTPGIDEYAGRQPGLHVDNIFHRPLRERLSSPRRLTANRGPGPRWLVLVMPDIITIANILELGPDEVPASRHLSAYALEHADDLRCLWVRQRPGEAYIAPTELCGHDGSTLGETQGSTVDMLSWDGPVGELPSVLGDAPRADSR
jgi:hypothetical protein